MTSRTPIGAPPPRPPQRTLSSPSLPGQRSLSQQYHPQSPVRKEPSFEALHDIPDAAPARYHAAPRRGGSRLKLELSTDTIMTDAPTCNSPLHVNQLRITPLNEAVDVAQPSPGGSVRQLHAEADNTPLPMPKRRVRYTRAPARSLAQPMPAPGPAAAAKKDSHPKPYTIEYPSQAPRYKPMKSEGPRSSTILPPAANSGYADFFPWTGNHAEDQFSENVIRNGYFHKAPPNQAESATAKPALFPLLKQKNCLNALSSVFLGVLAQRRHSSQITSPSTFKPPPRVTLTDTKREMWLKDLANPATPLRRLSRTIPHGIRGKVLLEHCLNKNVPTERAVWLAKCVGANDLRAFRRKGVNQTFMGGETKWIKDWTLHVEQFVENVVSSFDMPDWKAKVTYAYVVPILACPSCLRKVSR
jgi:mediator of RNA polymerase II transcription subunit 12